MKPWLKYSLIVLGVISAGAAVYLLTSRSKSRLIPFIPNNAAYVVQFDIKALSDIFAQNNLSQLEVLKEGLSVSKKEGGTLGKILHGLANKPMESGIRFQAPAFIFGEKIARGPAHAFIAELSDEDMFTDFVTRHRATGTSIEKDGDIHFIECETGLFLSWGNGVVLLSRQMTESQQYPIGIIKRSSPGSEGNLFIKQLLEEKGPVTYLIKPDLLAQMNEQVTLPGVREFTSAVPRGLAYIGKMEFNNGAINNTYRTVAIDQKALESMKMVKAAGNAPALMAVTSLKKEPAMLFSMAMDLNAWYNQIKVNLEADTRKKLEENETFKTMMSTFSGDILFCASPIEQDDYGHVSMEWQLVLGTRKKATDLETQLRDMDWQDEQGQIRIPMLWQPVQFLDRAIVIGKGTGERGTPLPGQNQNPYQNAAISGFLDVNAMFKDMNNGSREEDFKAITDAGMKLLVGGDNATMHIDLTFADKNANSLAQLLKMANRIYVNDKRKKEALNNVRSDTTHIRTLENSKY